MTVGELIVQRLSRPGAAVLALGVSNIHPSFIPDAAPLPAIMYERKPHALEAKTNVDGTRDHTRTVYKLNAYAGQDSYDVASHLATAIATDLEGYRGIDGDMTTHMVYFNSQYDEYDGTAKRHRITVELEFWYT